MCKAQTASIFLEVDTAAGCQCICPIRRTYYSTRSLHDSIHACRRYFQPIQGQEKMRLLVVAPSGGCSCFQNYVNWFLKVSERSNKATVYSNTSRLQARATLL